MQKVIQTIKSFNESQLKEKGSLFIAKCKPVSSLDAAKEFLLDLKKEYYDATHHCFAVKLHGGNFQYSDDGEPNGTAGIRILNAIDHFELTDLIVVVVRYFGGTKLGVGPLGKAYFNAAFNLLNATEKITLKEYFSCRILLSPNFSGDVFNHLQRNDCIILNQDFDKELMIDCLIPTDNFAELENLFTELSGRKIQIIKQSKPVLNT